jgi:hypothetical protein
MVVAQPRYIKKKAQQIGDDVQVDNNDDFNGVVFVILALWMGLIMPIPGLIDALGGPSYCYLRVSAKNEAIGIMPKAQCVELNRKHNAQKALFVQP